METIIEKYNSLLKQLVHDVLSAQNRDDGSINSGNSTENWNGHGDDLHWNIVHHSLYVIEVGELAKKNFVQFGLTGSCAHLEVGGRYLRLYGVLSAVYQQKLAIETLLAIYHIKETEKISSGLNNSAIISLSHKLGINATYLKSNLNEPEELSELYELSRPDLELNQIKLLIRKFEFKKYDLFEDLKCFDRKVELTLSFMIGELLKRTCKNQPIINELYASINKEKDHVYNLYKQNAEA